MSQYRHGIPFGNGKILIQGSREKMNERIYLFSSFLQGKKAFAFVDRKELAFLCTLSDLIQGQGCQSLNADAAMEKQKLTAVLRELQKQNSGDGKTQSKSTRALSWSYAIIDKSLQIGSGDRFCMLCVEGEFQETRCVFFSPSFSINITPEYI